MKKYYVNPEFKISQGVIILLIMIFFGLNYFSLKYSHDRLKDDYIKSVGAITARVVQVSPELEQDIIPLITQEATLKEINEGRGVLKKYGLTSELEDELFPYMNKTIKTNGFDLILIYILLLICLLLFNYYQHGFFYKRIRKITTGAKKVIDGDYNITIDENIEGDFSKLASSFNSMIEIIRSNISELQKEKDFLVDLLASISHQLKTPISSVMLYNDIVLNKDLEKKQREKFLINNQNQLDRMNSLIKNLLRLAKIDAKALVFDEKYQSINETVNEVIRALESKALENTIKIDLIQTKDVYLEHDRLWMQEALINIVKNAIEHTRQHGNITIEIIQNQVYKRIIIKDTGEGIKKEDLPNIFKKFYKVKTSKKNDSVGIGLALAKSIVESHEGIIEVKSKVGIGTNFNITFLK